jgi:pimeloyl-ACP methyl ester carboxylesterase
MQLEDGTWQWRYRRFGGSPLSSPNDPAGVAQSGTDKSGGADSSKGGADGMGFSPLWDSLQASHAPVLLVRGMLKQSVVDDADVSELQRRRPDAVVVEVANAGHSVQGDAPLELANLITNFVS